MKLTLNRTIAATPEKVFALASDFAHAADTISGITRVEMLTDPPVGVGTRFRETRVFFGREATEEMEVTEFTPPSGYVLGCQNHGTRYRSEFRFTPIDQGSEVEMSFEATPVTLVARVMSVLTRPMMRSMARTITRDLEDLKAAAEAPTSGERGGGSV